MGVSIVMGIPQKRCMVFHGKSQSKMDCFGGTPMTWEITIYETIITQQSSRYIPIYPNHKVPKNYHPSGLKRFASSGPVAMVKVVSFSFQKDTRPGCNQLNALQAAHGVYPMVYMAVYKPWLLS